jgi:hypothetical protein
VCVLSTIDRHRQVSHSIVFANWFALIIICFFNNKNRYSLHLTRCGCVCARSRACMHYMLQFSIIQYKSNYLYAGYLYWLGPSVNFVGKLTCLEITGNQIKCSTVLWLLELQIWHKRKVLTQVHTVNSNSWTLDCHCSLFSQKKSNYLDFLHIRMTCHSIWISGVPLYCHFCT